MEPFEYAVKKDVRNNPIVREIDQARHRELWRSVGVAGFGVLVLLFSAWPHFQILQHGYQVEQLQREHVAQQEVARRLKLEIETLRSPKRIEALARDRLQLVPPSSGEAIILERVHPTEPPPSTMVARR